MNERFYLLSKEKQQGIINAGFRIFSQNSYKKIWEIVSRGDMLNAPKLEKDFSEMLSFWKNIYLRKEF